ncbi:MAG: hypothetical protein OXT06_02385 [Rhodospirillaceae bacterium]|nr:hypothetical protein [Rhodospirillaceae bacterium]MDD9913523.1 hypothetical protein [Rhodospirillaceae bacterium]MDD9924222.1 hypothetical protein [Rhodospirillaceae bacterium]
MDFNLEFHDIVGSAGVVLVVGMYSLLQLGKISSERPLFSVLNGFGSAFILYSLYFEFNLSAALIEGFWLVASVYGFFRVRRAV